MLTRLHGICFQELPHIRCDWREKDLNEFMPSGACQKRRGERCTIVREEGKLWDSDARPAYLVLMDGSIPVGYLPLVETVKEEALKAKYDKKRKVWKEGFEAMPPEQFRAYAKALNDRGETECFHDWADCTDEEARQIYDSKIRECEVVEVVRDWIYCEISRNHLTPTGWILPTYFDKIRGRNHEEIGDICSLSVSIDGIY